MFDHNALPVLIALKFSLATPNLQTAVLWLTSSTSKIEGVFFLHYTS